MRGASPTGREVNVQQPDVVDAMGGAVGGATTGVAMLACASGQYGVYGQRTCRSSFLYRAAYRPSQLPGLSSNGGWRTPPPWLGPGGAHVNAERGPVQLVGTLQAVDQSPTVLFVLASPGHYIRYLACSLVHTTPTIHGRGRRARPLAGRRDSSSGSGRCCKSS